jgi:hypothetical protein
VATFRTTGNGLSADFLKDFADLSTLDEAEEEDDKGVQPIAIKEVV